MLLPSFLECRSQVVIGRVFHHKTENSQSANQCFVWRTPFVSDETAKFRRSDRQGVTPVCALLTSEWAPALPNSRNVHARNPQGELASIG